VRIGRTAAVTTVGVLILIGRAFAADSSGVILAKAMRDELQHSRALDSGNLEKPYFISYTFEDGEAFGALAALGGVLGTTDTEFRVPRIQVRVGDYQFDNTNYVGSGLNFGSRYRSGLQIRRGIAGAQAGRIEEHVGSGRASGRFFTRRPRAYCGRAPFR
jgi:hypothetical protein